MRRPCAVRLSLLLALGAATGLAAQAPTEPEPEPRDTVYELEGVVVRGARSVGSTGGASAVVVRPDSLALRPMATVEDALRGLPFIRVRQNSRGLPELSVRGSESRQVAVLLDGVPLSLAWDHRTDPSAIPLLGIESLSLVRGLPSMLGGPNVLGGVVEVNVGRSTGARPPATGVQLTGGWDDAGYEAVGAAGAWSRPTTGGDLVVRGGAGYRSRDGVALPGGVADPGSAGGLRANSFLREAQAFAALRWEGPVGSWVAVSGSGFRAERGVPPELHVEQPRLWRVPLEWQTVAAVSAGTGHHPTPWGVGDLEASIGYTTGAQEIEAFGSMAYDDVVATESGDDRTLTLRLLGDHTLGRRGELRGSATLARIDHRESLDGAAADRFRQRLFSLGSEIAWRFPAETRVTVGAALDRADTPETGGRPAVGSLSAWGGRVGLSTLGIRPDLQLHASASSRARFPSLRELYSVALGRFEPNPGLRPERLVAAEVGATWKRPAGEVQLTVFRNRLRDAIARAATPEGRYRRVNQHRIDSHGAELLVARRLGAAELNGDLMLQDVTLRGIAGADGAARPEHMPELQAGLDVAAPLALGVRGLAGLRHTGPQYCVHPERGTDVRLDASTRVDLGLRRSWRLPGRLWQSLRGTLALDNATDAAAYDQCGMPQPGRTLRLGLELR